MRIGPRRHAIVSCGRDGVQCERATGRVLEPYKPSDSRTVAKPSGRAREGWTMTIEANAALITTSLRSGTATVISMSGTLDPAGAAMVATYLLDQADVANGDFHLDLRAVDLVNERRRRAGHRAATPSRRARASAPPHPARPRPHPPAADSGSASFRSRPVDVHDGVHTRQGHGVIGERPAPVPGEGGDVHREASDR